MISGEEADLEAIATLFTARTGVEIRTNRRELVRGRLAPRLRKLKIATYEDYRRYLERHLERELPYVVGLLTTHKTEFFREAEQFVHFRDTVLKPLLSVDKPVRIWSAASSTGEEAYSIAMLVAESLLALGRSPGRYAAGVTILGSDVDDHSLMKASNAVFTERSIQGLSRSRLQTWFQKGTGALSGHYRIHDALHAMCRFERRNLLGDRIEGPFDAIFCRNVFIYFTTPNIVRATEGLVGALAPGGFLYVGLSEPLASPPPSLTAVGQSIYRKNAASQKGTPPCTANEVDSPASPSTARGRKTRVLIVDDSRTVRHALRVVLEKRSEFFVVGEAACPREARDILATQKVDVMTLDINMPEESGLAYLESVQASSKGMKDHPAVVIVSSMNPDDANVYLRCVELGATAYIEKPTNLADQSVGMALAETLLAASRHGPEERRVRSASFEGRVVGSSDRGRMVDTGGDSPRSRATRPLARDAAAILIGASTGGTVALVRLLADFPNTFPPVVITQHIPDKFVPTFVLNLSQTTGKNVVMGAHGDRLSSGTVYVVPGGVHGRVVESGGLRLEFSTEPPVNRHKPAVEVLFQSGAAIARRRPLLAVLLTGMGEDGAQGLLDLRKAGATTVCQDAASCVVYGMPRAAVDLGAAHYQLDLSAMATAFFGGS